MPKFRYTGSDERVFPTLGLTVKPDEEFDAPEGFEAADVSPLHKSSKKAAESTTSASSDLTEGE